MMTDASTCIGVKCIDHVTLVVKDLEASRKFYCDFLGMKQVDRPGFSFDGRWFQAGETQIHLILEHADSGRAGVPDQPASSRTHHFAFQVADSREAAKQAESLGLPIVSGPVQRPDGAVQTFVRDPDGHMVELCSV